MRAPLPLKTPVSWPRRASSTCWGKSEPWPGGLSERATPPPQAEAIRLSCPAFSSSVMRAISGSMKAGISTRPAARRSARAGLASHAAAAPAPINAARREIGVSSMSPPEGKVGGRTGRHRRLDGF